LEIGCLFCVEKYKWLTGCSGVGAGVGSEGASSRSAGLAAIVCVWRAWLWEKSGMKNLKIWPAEGLLASLEGQCLME